MLEDLKLIGIIFPLPERLISRIFDNGKRIFTKFTTHPPSEESIRIRSGNKMFFYKSRANKTLVGEAIIKKIEFMLPSEVMNKYKEELVNPPEEMSEYVGGRNNKKMLVLDLSNIRRYTHPIIMKTPVTMAGLYVTEKNYKDIFGCDIKVLDSLHN